jgi:hypothetical protein
MKGEADDWLSELPPLDGAEDDPAAEDGTHDDPLPEGDGDASLDDSASDDLEVDDGVDIADDEPSAAEDDERWEADVGEPELDLTDDANGEAAELDAPGVGETDLDLDDDLPPSADDAGEEGTNDAVEQSIDEELPALDADDEGDFEDALLLETGLMVAAPEGPRWADQPWQRVPSADRALALAVPDDDALATVAMCVAPELLVSVTAAGRLLVDGDAVDARAGRFVPSALSSAKSGPPLLGLERRDSSAVLWAASRNGLIARSTDLGRSWSTAVDLGKSLSALAIGADGSLGLLAVHGDEAEVLTSTDGLTWDARPVTSGGRPLPLGRVGNWLAIGASALAIGDASGVWLARAGDDFIRVAAAAATTTGLFVGSAEGAPLVFAEPGMDVEENARLVRTRSDGRVEILADIGPPEADDRSEAPSVLAMSWDASSRVLRVAFSTAVCNLAEPQSKPSKA